MEKPESEKVKAEETPRVELSPEQIASPYQQPIATIEILNKVKEMSGSRAVFVAVSNETLDHVCEEGKCQGHYINMNSLGFTDQEILNMISHMANLAGFTLIPTPETGETLKDESGEVKEDSGLSDPA